ncbi:MAG TPA: SDR family oxidoreductase [Mycobacteriales bacterium]|nr:SDR family oxidoreductase [Mycobacteriales bacterium]
MSNQRSVVVITGAASGMGAACARRLMRGDRTLLLVDVNEAALATVKAELRDLAFDEDQIHVQRTDITSAADISALAAKVQQLGPLGAVLNVAGVSPTMADWRRVFEVDLVGTAMVLEAMLPLAGPGTVAVCWSSSSAHMGPMAAPAPEITAAMADPLSPDLYDKVRAALGDVLDGEMGSGIGYGTAKRGVIQLVGRQAAAWGAKGARICSISPGMIDTPMGRQEFEKQPAMAFMLQSTPLARFGASSEIAELAAFMISPDAGFLSGVDILLDGGCTAALNAMMTASS